MIQVVVYLREGPSRDVKDKLASELTHAVRGLVDDEGPIEVWFREYGPGRVYLGDEEA